MKLPEEIVVGFNSEINNLSFITYQKNKDELAKQKSFDSWRDKKIEPKIFKNEPVTGHKLIFFVGGSSYYESRLAQARMEDPRGFSFEIKVDNLMQLLTSSNLINQKLDGKYIYGWNGTELKLIDINSEEYKAQKQRDTLTEYDPKDCVPGEFYHKDGKDYLFLGKIKRLVFVDKHIREHWLDITHDLYPQYKSVYIFKWKFDWDDNSDNSYRNETRYDFIASSKLTNKFVKSDRVFESDLNEELEEFYTYDHNTTSPIEYNMDKFDRFEIDEKYKCTSLDQVPVRCKCNDVVYVYLIDNDYIVYGHYRDSHNPDLIIFSHFYKIKQNGNKSYIEDDLIETDDKHKSLYLSNLIKTGRLYIITKEKEINNKSIYNFFITDGNQKMMFNKL